MSYMYQPAQECVCVAGVEHPDGSYSAHALVGSSYKALQTYAKRRWPECTIFFNRCWWRTK